MEVQVNYIIVLMGVICREFRIEGLGVEGLGHTSIRKIINHNPVRAYRDMSYELKLGWGAPTRGCIRVTGLGGTFKEYRLLQSALLQLQSRAHMGIGRIIVYFKSQA